MNKQEKADKKTTPTHINTHTILQTLLCFRPSLSIRKEYNINTHCITVLLGCYICYQYYKSTFSLSCLVSVIQSYSIVRVRKYVNQLIGLGFITQASFTPDKYTITDLGLSIVEQISNQADKVMYEFCNKYNIEL